MQASEHGRIHFPLLLVVDVIWAAVSGFCHCYCSAVTGNCEPNKPPSSLSCFSRVFYHSDRTASGHQDSSQTFTLRCFQTLAAVGSVAVAPAFDSILRTWFPALWETSRVKICGSPCLMYKANKCLVFRPSPHSNFSTTCRIHSMSSPIVNFYWPFLLQYTRLSECSNRSQVW